MLTSVANDESYAHANTTPPLCASPHGWPLRVSFDLLIVICTGYVRVTMSRLSSLCFWSMDGAMHIYASFMCYENESSLNDTLAALVTPARVG